jgi:hypothetical protein
MILRRLSSLLAFLMALQAAGVTLILAGEPSASGGWGIRLK